LHEIDELVESDLFAKLVNELAHLSRVSLQRAHNRFKVFGVNFLGLVFIEEIKDFSKVLHFVFGELLHLALTAFLVLDLHIILSSRVVRDLWSACLQLVQLYFLFKFSIVHF